MSLNLFKLIIILILSSIINLVKTNEIVCVKNSFDIDIKKDFIFVDRLNLVLFYTLKQTNQLPAQVTVSNYVQKCLDQVVFKLEATNTQQSFIYTQKINQTDDLNSIFIEFKNLNPLTTYNIYPGYKQIGDDVNYISNKLEKGNICFDRPSVPINVLKILQNDGSIKIEWTRPEILNSESICYYLIKRRYLNEPSSSAISEKTNQTFYIINRDLLNKDIELKLSAYNDASCYIDKYPFVKNCTDKIQSSQEIIINLKADTSPTTATSTKPGGSASTKSINSILILFLITIIIYIK